jgi:FMN phosphatase YigB (HAD superfamily)
MRIGIDCDGVLRDFIPDLVDLIKEKHPEHTDKILVPKSWDWEDWLPFWSEDETEKFVFEDNYKKLFGPEANVIPSVLEDWPKLVEWAKENGHELVLVSAQRSHCEELTTEWLQRWGIVYETNLEYRKSKEVYDY